VRLTAYSLVLLIAAGCAQEGTPPGGPPDTFAPRIVEFSPPHRAVSVPVSVTPVLTFNERIDTRSLEEALLVVPLVSFKLESNWDGNEITLRFAEPLQKAQTYVVTLGTAIRDMRGNRMTAATIYAFSTGPVIDKGEISGSAAVGPQPVSGAYIWAYDVNQKPSPDPARIPPDYIVQTGTDGTFAFSNLSAGVYRIFAFQDRGRDLRYDIGVDPIGVPPQDIILSDSIVTGGPVRLEMTVRDTTGLRIQSIRTIHTRQVNVRINTPIPEEELHTPNGFRIRAADGPDTLGVTTVYRDPTDSSTITLLTAPQQRSRQYMLLLPPLKDRSGRRLTEQNASGGFTGTSLNDDAPPVLKWTDPPDGTKQTATDAGLRLAFSEALRVDPDAIRLFAADSLIATTLSWSSPAVAVIKPDTLLPDTDYRIEIVAAGVRDAARLSLDTGKMETDTLRVTFRTINPSVYGVVLGTTTDRDADAQGPVILTFTDAKKQSRRIRLETPGPYRAETLLPGKYVLHTYRDANANGIQDTGSVSPFVPAERSVVRSDTVVVRSGWETEGIDIEIVP